MLTYEEVMQTMQTTKTCGNFIALLVVVFLEPLHLCYHLRHVPWAQSDHLSAKLNTRLA